MSKFGMAAFMTACVLLLIGTISCLPTNHSAPIQNGDNQENDKHGIISDVNKELVLTAGEGAIAVGVTSTDSGHDHLLKDDSSVVDDSLEEETDDVVEGRASKPKKAPKSPGSKKKGAGTRRRPISKRCRANKKAAGCRRRKGANKKKSSSKSRQTLNTLKATTPFPPTRAAHQTIRINP